MALTKEKEVTFIGKCNFRGNERMFGIKAKDRRQHVYVLGKTGTGKSTLLENMVLQDIHAGRGVGIIDPHGEFVDDHVLPQIPASRINDVIYFNPVDSEYPIGFNVLEVPDLKYKHLVVSNLLAIFTKIWANVWSARMEYILQNCIMALLDTPGTTLLGIPRILVDKDYRQKIVANVKDPVVRSFWIHEYETWRDQFRNEAIVPIQNKVGQFLNTGFIRNIVGQPKSTLNIPEIMNEGKILLVNVSKGKIGEDNSQLLGAMIITTIQLAAMERVRIPEEDRKDFYLYVDEFQNFATDSFASILSEARKYRLDLTIAHQYVGQLVTDVSTKVRDAVFGNVGTMIVFRVGAADAEALEKEFAPEFAEQDLIGIPNHHIYLKIMVDGITSRPFSAVTLAPLKMETDPSLKDTIIRTSRERYSQPRSLVEERIMRWSSAIGEDVGLGESASSHVNSSMRGATFAGDGAPTLHETPCWNCGKTATVPFKPDGKRPVYCSSCLKQIEEGKLIPLPERMPQVGRAKFSPSLEHLGIEFAPASGTRGMSLDSQDTGRGNARESRDTSMPREGERQRTMDRENRGSQDTHTKFHRMPPQNEDNSIREERHVSSGPRARMFSSDTRGVTPSRDTREIPRGPHNVSSARAGISSRPVARVASGAKSVSLSALKPKDSGTDEEGEKRRIHTPERKNNSPNRPVINVSELRKALGDALKTKHENEDVKSVPAEVSKKVSSAAHDTHDTKEIQPGETVKF